MSFKSFVSFGLPERAVWTIPTEHPPVPESPFKSEWLGSFYKSTLSAYTPITIAVVYFSSVHLINPIVRRRQLAKYYKANPTAKGKKLSETDLKRLPAAPYAIARTPWFKGFVLLHNVFLSIYSIWTFIGMTSSIIKTMELFKLDILPNFISQYNQVLNVNRFELFVESICDVNQGIFSRFNSAGRHNLEVLGYWFYISKFYEVLDTVIILLKGKPSSLLQSYHHSGAMMCMWAGVRFQSPPIWIFVVFNSFIHSLMYIYFSLACLRIRVPTIFKKALTSLQITQFIVGGSIAVTHAFVKFIDTSIDSLDGNLIACVNSPNKALSLFVNVAYLTPLTALFGAFYIESYLKRGHK